MLRSKSSDYSHYYSPIDGDVVKTEVLMKFMYFLRDIGISSADQQAMAAFQAHVGLIAELLSSSE